MGVRHICFHLWLITCRSALINSVRHAADQGADIINMSLGGPTGHPALHDAIKYAVNQKGALVVVASGNEREGRVAANLSYPAMCKSLFKLASLSLIVSLQTQRWFRLVRLM